MSTICLMCGVATAVGEEMGEMGLPSLDEASRGRGRHRLVSRLSSGGDADTAETFGHLYSGFAAIGLLTHPIEAYRSFLVEHSGRGHRLYQWSDEHEDLPEGYEELKHRFTPYVRPRRLPGFVRARVRFSCAKCEDAYESGAAEWVRPFERRTLSGEAVERFRRRTVRPSEHNIHDAWPFQITLFDDLEDWLRLHARHRIVIDLVREEGRPTGARRRRRVGGEALPVPEPRKPPALSPEEDERLLGAFSDEAWPLVAGLHHREAAARADSAERLGRRGEPGTLAYLVPVLDDPEEAVRVAAVGAIAALGGPRSIRPLGQALLDAAEGVRGAARQALARAGLSEKDALQKARAPRGPVEEKRANAAEMAGVPAGLARALKHAVHPHHSSRGWAAARLRRGPKPDVTRAILALLADYSDYVMAEAAEAARALRIQASLEPLLTAAPTATERSLQPIIKALGAIGDPRGLPVILPALDHRDSNTRGDALTALAHLEGAAAAAALVQALKSGREDVRAHAANLLGERRVSSMIPALAAALSDEDRQVRFASAEALVRIGEQTGLAAVRAAAARGDALVALAAHEFLIGDGDPRTEDTLVEALHWAGVRGVKLEVATRYVLSGNERLVAAGKVFLGGRKPVRGVKPLAWGSGRER